MKKRDSVTLQSVLFADWLLRCLVLLLLLYCAVAKKAEDKEIVLLWLVNRDRYVWVTRKQKNNQKWESVGYGL